MLNADSAAAEHDDDHPPPPIQRSWLTTTITTTGTSTTRPLHNHRNFPSRILVRNRGGKWAESAPQGGARRPHLEAGDVDEDRRILRPSRGR